MGSFQMGNSRRAYIAIIGLPLVLCFACLVCGFQLFNTAGRQFRQWTGYVTPTPSYFPLTGRVYIATLGELGRGAKLWSRPGSWGSKNEVAFVPYGAPIEIVQSVWLVESEGQGCYHYLVRTEDGKSGWLEGTWLTQDPGQPSKESCYKQSPTPTPQYHPIPMTADLLYVSTLGTQKEAVDFWSARTLDKDGSQPLFSRLHGTRVEMLGYADLEQPGGQLCYNYLVRTEDGLEGWVSGGALTQDLNLPPKPGCVLLDPPPMEGNAFATTMGTSSGVVDFWKMPDYGVDHDRQDCLFSQPHGTPVGIVEYRHFFHWLPDNSPILCYTYLVRTREGTEGWGAGSSLTKDVGQPSPEQNCSK